MWAEDVKKQGQGSQDHPGQGVVISPYPRAHSPHGSKAAVSRASIPTALMCMAAASCCRVLKSVMLLLMVPYFTCNNSGQVRTISIHAQTSCHHAYACSEACRPWHWTAGWQCGACPMLRQPWTQDSALSGHAGMKISGWSLTLEVKYLDKKSREGAESGLQALGKVIEHLNEARAYDLALLLRVTHTLQALPGGEHSCRTASHLVCLRSGLIIRCRGSPHGPSLSSRAAAEDSAMRGVHPRCHMVLLSLSGGCWWTLHS